jgi:hypothetical protein
MVAGASLKIETPRPMRGLHGGGGGNRIIRPLFHPCHPVTNPAIGAGFRGASSSQSRAGGEDIFTEILGRTKSETPH